MLNNDKCSIIIPVYNASKTLKNCLNSLLNQSYKNIEIIFVDDGSTDNSLNLLIDLKKVDSRIIVLHKENGGVSSARNLGIKAATGKYICFVDSDDTIDLSMIKILHDNIIKNKCELSMCNYNLIKKDKKKFKNNNSFIINNKADFYKNINIYEGFLCNKMFLTNYVKKIKLDESIHFCEDELFLFKYVELTNKYYYDNTPLYNYYIYDNSGSSLNEWNEKKISVIKAREEILEITSKYGPLVSKTFYIKYFNFLNDISNRYINGSKYKEKTKNVYNKIIKSKNIYSLKEKIIIIFKYRFFIIFNFIKKIIK